MKKGIIYIFFSIVTISIALINCSSSKSPVDTLKIGLVFSFKDDVGLDAIRSIELVAGDDNKNGGIKIGDKKYIVEIVKYDNQNAQSTEVAAINRLIFEDNVKFIITQGLFEGAWLPVTEKNKVITLTINPLAFITLAPWTRYSFAPSFMNPEIPAKMGWFCNKYKDQAKNMVIAFIDNQFGHMVSDLTKMQFQAFGVNPKVVFFPANQVDLSAVATKIVNMKPAAVMGMSGSSTGDGLFFNAVHQAGYKGLLFSPTNNPVGTWLKIASPEALEGFITGMYATEAEPPLTKSGQYFKNLWVDKYGKWDNPISLSVTMYFCLKAAVEKAGSIDSDKVADTIAGGLKFGSPIGDGKMISRPDIGNNRTVDSISDYYMKTIHNGKAEILDTLKLDEAHRLFLKASPPLPADAKQGPPPGGLGGRGLLPAGQK